jgi:hypothetical protein
MTTLTDEDKAGLSEAEIAALEEEDEGLDELKPGNDDVAKAEAEAKVGADAEAAEKEPAPFVPQIDIVDEAELEKLKTAFEEAKEAFDDGDIDYAELDEAKDAFNEANWQKNFAEKSNASMRQNHWILEQERFLNSHTDFRDNETLNAAFAIAVNRLIDTDEGAAMSDRQVLEAAKDKVVKDLVVVGSVRTRTRADEDITDLAAADEAANQSNDFAHLDKLEGDAYQAAIDKLTPAQLERYENAQ